MIRQATVLDIDRIVDLAFKYNKETVTGAYSMDREYISNLLVPVMTHPDHLFLVAVDGVEIVGMFWGCATQPLPWTQDIAGIDITFYVLPEYRGRPFGVRMINRWAEWCKSKGCVDARLCAASGITNERTLKLYQSRGFNQLSYVVTKEF